MLNWLESSFGSALSIAIWVALPLYGTALGLATVRPAATTPSNVDKGTTLEAVSAAHILLNQLLLLSGPLALFFCFRGFEGGLCQGQLYLGVSSIKLHLLTLLFMLLGLMALLPLAGHTRDQRGALGFQI
jgi:hypothetical protein